MAEIILSFFSVLGLLFLSIYVCDYFFYRNFKKRIITTIDTRLYSLEECMEVFELITSVRQMTIGKALVNFVVIIVSTRDDEKTRLASDYMRIFKIPGEIQKEDSL